MFYESRDVEVNLTCPFCKNKYLDIVKLIPECGNSICGDCYNDLRNGRMIIKFQCKPCGDSWHTMPSDELPDNKALMKILRVRPQEKPLSDKAKNLKLLLEHLQRRIMNLSSWDEHDEIKIYCEQLEHEIVMSSEKAIKHINKLKDDLLKVVDDYRQGLVANSVQRQNQLKTNMVDYRHMNFDKEKLKVSSEVIRFSEEWLDNLNNGMKNSSSEELLDAQKQAKDYMLKLTQIEKGIRQQTFTDRFMKFNASNLFCDYDGHLGEFELNHEIDYRIEECSHKYTAYSTGKVLFLPNGDLATCSANKADHSIKIWNHVDYQLEYELQGHSDTVVALALLNDAHLASGSVDTTIKIWCLDNRQLLVTLEGHTDTVCSIIPLFRNTLASCSRDGTIRKWDPFGETETLLATASAHVRDGCVTQLDVLSNGNLVSCSDSYSNSLGSILALWPSSLDRTFLKSVRAHTNDALSSLVLSNDSLVIGFADGTIQIHNFFNDNLSLVIAGCHIDGVYSLAQLTNVYLISGGSANDTTLKIWNPFDGRLIKSIETFHTGEILSLSVSPDQKYLASASKDKSVKIWSIKL